jgi:RimJ/RimL family protein N-acetyltransferase
MNVMEKGKEYFLKSVKALKAGGIGLLFKRVLKVLFATNSACWFERDLGLPIADSSPRLPLRVDFNSSAETLAWLKAEERSWMLNPEEIEISLGNKHYYPNVRHENHIIGCIKAGFEQFYIADFKRSVFFPKEVAYHTDLYIAPEFRNSGAAGYLLTETMKFLRDKGFKKERCHIPPWNTASIKVHSKTGFRKIGHIRFLKIFGFKIFIGYSRRVFLKR